MVSLVAFASGAVDGLIILSVTDRLRLGLENPEKAIWTGDALALLLHLPGHGWGRGGANAAFNV